MIGRAILIAIAWLGLATAGMAQSVPTTSFAFPVLSGRVVDEAGMLSTGDRATLTASLAELEAKTTNQLVIVTLKSLQGTTIEGYGYQLGRRWKIGQKDRDTGVLLLVAPAEKVVRIEVGYGLEGTLTDAMTKTIIETAILPAFRTGDFAGGIKKGAHQIIQLLGAEAGRPAQSARNPAPGQGAPATPVWLVIVLGVGGVGMLIYCAVAGGAWCRVVMQILVLTALSGRRGSSNDRSSPFSGGGGSFGGGGSSGRW